MRVFVFFVVREGWSGARCDVSSIWVRLARLLLILETREDTGLVRILFCCVGRSRPGMIHRRLLRDSCPWLAGFCASRPSLCMQMVCVAWHAEQRVTAPRSQFFALFRSSQVPAILLALHGCSPRHGACGLDNSEQGMGTALGDSGWLLLLELEALGAF